MERPKVGSGPPAEQNGQAKAQEFMPAADAIADAETLRINACFNSWGPTLYRAIRAAEEHAEWALVEAPYAHAASAARAAFRAVPELRG